MQANPLLRKDVEDCTVDVGLYYDFDGSTRSLAIGSRIRSTIKAFMISARNPFMLCLSLTVAFTPLTWKISKELKLIKDSFI